MTLKRLFRSLIFNMLGFIVTFVLLGYIILIALLDTLYGALIYLPNKWFQPKAETEAETDP